MEVTSTNGVRGAALLLLTVVLVACSAVGSGTASPSAGPAGYLYASSSEAIFVEWDAASGATTGTVDWRSAPAQRITASFTVEKTSGGFAFRFTPGSLAGWTGTVDGAALTLVIPSSTGSLRDVPMRAATRAAFEQAAAALE